MKRLWAKLVTLALFGGAVTAVPAQNAVRAVVGGLSIEAGETSSTGFNSNYGRVKQSTASYRVMHKGKPVTMPDASGKPVALSFWEAWTLPDAPRPAILAANRATYLITEENGEPRVQLLRGEYHDAATWQWLDADGKVGERYSVYIRDKVEGPREIRGGTALAVSGIVLLDIKTLQTQRMDIAGDFEHLKQSDGYATGDRSVIMYSSQAKQVAALGHNEAGTFAVGSKNNPDFAMVALNIATGTHYAVPFDRNAARLAMPYEDATPAWAANHFEWRADAQGRLRLQPRKLAKPQPWLGRFRNPPRENDSSATSFVLMPTDERMIAPLMKVIARDFGGREVPLVKDEEPGSKTRMEVNGLPISIRLYAAESGSPSRVDFSTDVPVISTLEPGSSWKLKFSFEPEKIYATNRLVMKMGEHINQLLAKGELQAFFTTVSKEER